MNVITTQPQQSQDMMGMMGGPNMGMMQPGMMPPGGGMMDGEAPVPEAQNFIPGPIPGVPPGLEVLHLTEHLFIRQVINPPELFNVPNKYEVLDTWGRRIFFAVETTGTRNCCNCEGPLTMNVLDFQGQVVMTIGGGIGIGSCCCPYGGCCGEGNVFIGRGSEELFGSVAQTSTCCTPHFLVKDSAGVTMFTLMGLTGSTSLSFELYQGEVAPGNPVGATSVGQINKIWAGIIQEYFTSADNYGINFPPDLPVGLKAVLLAAAILIDFKFFNVNPNQRSSRGFQKMNSGGAGGTGGGYAGRH